jgi:hypothetical protein
MPALLAAAALAACGGPLLAQPAAGTLGFAVPAGYTQQRQGEVVILAPANPDPNACIYGLAGRHGATGPLEAAAEAAVTQIVVPGWRRLDDRHAAMRGTSADGWPYAWWRAAFAGEMNGQRQVVNAAALVLPAGAGQVHVVWGMGSISRCLLDDATFEALFHSLRPSGWTSDGGRALTQALMGSWRFTAGAGSGLQQIAFAADGRYARDVGSSARVGVTERTSATATGGRFTLRGGDLTLAADHRPATPDRYAVRVYEEWTPGAWRRAMTLADLRGTPPTVAQYFRVEP